MYVLPTIGSSWKVYILKKPPHFSENFEFIVENQKFFSVYSNSNFNLFYTKKQINKHTFNR